VSVLAALEWPPPDWVLLWTGYALIGVMCIAAGVAVILLVPAVRRPPAPPVRTHRRPRISGETTYQLARHSVTIHDGRRALNGKPVYRPTVPDPQGARYVGRH
jgi:hypothetical protein